MGLNTTVLSETKFVLFRLSCALLCFYLLMFELFRFMKRCSLFAGAQQTTNIYIQLNIRQVKKYLQHFGAYQWLLIHCKSKRKGIGLLLFTIPETLDDATNPCCSISFALASFTVPRIPRRRRCVQRRLCARIFLIIAIVVQKNGQNVAPPCRDSFSPVGQFTTRKAQNLALFEAHDRIVVVKVSTTTGVVIIEREHERMSRFVRVLLFQK